MQKRARMDVLRLVDRLDDMVRNAGAARFGAQVRLERQEAFELIEEIRRTIPEEIRQARWITGARSEMLREAKIEAERIVEEARAERRRLVADGVIGPAAEQRAAKILEAAEVRARHIRLGGEDYADEVLGSLQTGLTKLATVRRVPA